MKVKLVAVPSADTRITFVLKRDSRNAVKDFDAEKGTVAVRYHGKTTTIHCGLGEKKDCNARAVRAAAAIGIRKAAELKRSRVAVMDPVLDCCDESCARAALEGAILGSYVFAKFKSEKPKTVTTIEIISKRVTASAVDEITAVCAAACFTRDLVNDNASIMVPSRLADEARRLAAEGKLGLEVLDEKAIQEKGLGLLWAVGKGSPYPPRLTLIEYTGDPSTKKKIAVIGKGITFDSGGQNLKTGGHIEDMRSDMAGAAAVLGLMKALVVLKPGINVLGVIPSAHNAIGSKAYFPGDVYRSYSGKTVEITNTDAEGRLVLADAFSYALKHYKPTEMIDIATLTGAVVVALGETVAGLVSNTDALASGLFEAGEETGERLWRFPLYEEHSEAMKSGLADLRNTSKLKRGVAGSITGAAFLHEFVGTTPWAHLDIAGTAYNAGDARGEVPKYGTGFGVRLLWRFLQARFKTPSTT